MAQITKKWRPFPWCLLPDWVWYVQGVILLCTISIPLVSGILTTLPELKLLQAFYHRTVFGKRLTDSLARVKRAASQAVAKRIMLDPRNHDYLPWILAIAVLPPILLSWVWQRYRVHGFELSTLLIYHHLRIGPRFRLFAHQQTLVHKEGHTHKGFFKGPFALFNQVSGLWNGLFFGTPPFHYGTAHVKIHHRWHNDVDDVHTNIDLDRTVFNSFILYLPRFFCYHTGISPLVLFLKRREYELAGKLLLGLLYYYGAGALLCCCTDWKFACAYWLYPLLESTSLLAMIAYIWHAFVEPTDPTNQYVNSVTILNGGDNVWNEDYHVVHHHAPHIHWTDAPAHFEKNKAKYAEHTATIFQDCEEGNMIHWIFAGDWDSLAEHFVDLNGKMTHDEKKQLLVRRLKYQKEVSAVGPAWYAWGSSAVRDWDKPGKED